VAIERAPEIERLIEESRSAFHARDVEALTRMTSTHPSALMIGSAAEEVMQGHETIVKAMSAESEASGSRDFEFVPGEPTAYKDGDVGWALQIGKIRLADGGEIQTRTMSVLHREDGEWRFLQGCFSLAVPNGALRAGSDLAQELATAQS
jgi:ketosteroid isomerase-like protein